MRAMIFAAGLGTRLKPITDTLPKALVPVCGQPLLYHAISKLKASGCDDIVVNVHHFAEKIKDYLKANDFGVRISISDETAQLLETGGAIKHARALLEGSPEPFIVHNVDIVSNVDLSAIKCRNGALATLLVSDRKTRRYLLFNDDMRLVGWTDLSTGEVCSPYPALDPDKCRRLAFAGIHSISPHIFGVFDEINVPERFPIIDFYLKVCESYPIYGALQDDLELVDVGKIETLPEAERICEKLLK
ncbi:MAG: nucleotidyltransferase family protein [Bacteroidales bacterium]|nr:nucleotidyltransferase family protein [Bacteroidales bacterium]